MKTVCWERVRGESGLSLIEIIVGVIVLALTLLGLAAAGGIAARHVYYGRSDMSRWAAVQAQMENLLSQGYGNVSDSSAVVNGYPMSWTVTGTDPEQLTLIIERNNIAGKAVEDTVIAYMVSSGS